MITVINKNNREAASKNADRDSNIYVCFFKLHQVSL